MDERRERATEHFVLVAAEQLAQLGVDTDEEPVEARDDEDVLGQEEQPCEVVERALAMESIDQERTELPEHLEPVVMVRRQRADQTQHGIRRCGHVDRQRDRPAHPTDPRELAPGEPLGIGEAITGPDLARGERLPDQ